MKHADIKPNRSYVYAAATAWAGGTRDEYIVVRTPSSLSPSFLSSNAQWVFVVRPPQTYLTTCSVDRFVFEIGPVL